MKQAKPSGFWRIFGARMIDLIFVAILSVGTVFAFYNVNTKQFISIFGFYAWSLLTIIYIVLIMLVIPIISKGQGIGMYIMRIKVVSLRGNFYFNFFKRELAYSTAWIFVVLLTMVLINHTLIDRVVEIKGSVSNGIKDGPTLSAWQKTRITLCGSISGLITFTQMWLAITIIPNKQKRGWLDRWAFTQVIRTNKFTLATTQHKEKIIKPIKAKQIRVEYE